MTSPQPPSPLAQISPRVQSRRRAWRMLKDRTARHTVMLGGFGAIVAILLIFFYLLYVVFPLLEPASAEALAEYPVGDDAGETLYLAMEEQAEVAVRYDSTGRVRFFATADGKILLEQKLPLPDQVSIASLAEGGKGRSAVSLGLSDGSVLISQHAYQMSFPNDQRLITPRLDFPSGTVPLQVDSRQHALQRLAVQSGDRTTIAALTDDQRLLLVVLEKQISFIDETETLQRFEHELPNTAGQVRRLLVDPDQRSLYVATDQGVVAYYDISDAEHPQLVQQLGVVPPGTTLTGMKLLAGGISLLISSSDGQVAQWFPVGRRRAHRRQDVA